MNVKVTMMKAVKLEREKGINLLKGNPEIVELTKELTKKTEEFETLKEQNKHFVTESGKLNKKAKNEDGSYKKEVIDFFDKSTDLNSEIRNIRSDITLKRYDWLINLIPFFVEDVEIDDITKDELDEFDKELAKQIHTIFSDKKSSGTGK